MLLFNDAILAGNFIQRRVYTRVLCEL